MTKHCHTAMGLLVVGSLSLNSCYFNSAGHLFDKASRQEQVRLSELKHSGVVYTDGKQYYVEATAFRVGKPIKTQYDAMSKDKRQAGTEQLGTKMYEIPAEFALWLAGEGAEPTAPPSVRPVDAKEVKARCTATMPIKRAPNQGVATYQNKSPNAAWWYTAGSFDWLCVDLPITCVENCLVIAGCAVMVPIALWSESRDKKMKSIADPSSDPCSACGGTGVLVKGVQGRRYLYTAGNTDYYENYTYDVPCESCNGTGSGAISSSKLKGAILDGLIFGKTSSNGSFMGNFL